MEKKESTLFSYEQLQRWGRLVLQAVGMSQNEIEEVLEILLAANLRGVDSHGLRMLISYAERYKSIEHSEIRIEKDFAAGCIIDGGNHTGPMTSKFGLAKAMEKADKYGIGLSVVKESCHNGAVGYYAKLAAEAGYIGFSTTTVMPLIAPWGGLETFMGNNPFAVSFPYKKMPIVIDIANTVAARQKIFVYAKEGKKLPDGWAMDKNGKPTNNAQEAIEGFLMPVGGHKGAGLALMIDLILGSLAGGNFGRDICANTVTDKAQHITHMFIVMKPDFYVDVDYMHDIIDRYIDNFKKVRKKDDVEFLLLPGELEWNTEQDRKRNGIPINESDLNELNAYAEKIGVTNLSSLNNAEDEINE